MILNSSSFRHVVRGSSILSLLGLVLQGANPIITEVHTADPAALVHQGTVYIYTGHDEAPENENR